MSLFQLPSPSLRFIGTLLKSNERMSAFGADRPPRGSARIKNGLGVFLLPLKAARALAAAAFVYSAPSMSSPKSLPLINKHIRLC